MKWVVVFLILAVVASCIPYSKAPDIEGTRLFKAQKFKGDLPDSYALVFMNPYGLANFQTFMRERFDVGEAALPQKIPFTVHGHMYFMEVFDRVRYDRAFNLWGGILYELISSNDVGDILVDEEDELFADYEAGYAYIVLTVSDEYGRDALSEAYPEREQVLNYLRILYFDYTNPEKEFRLEKDSVRSSVPERRIRPF